jgi:AmmeMemoRadiSam system protein A
MDIILSQEDKSALCRIARRAFSARFSDTPDEPEKAPPGCHQPGGAFVTLKENGHLRGCIGRMTSSEPLKDTVALMAQAAAFEDPRFEPLDKTELPEIQVEITVLGKLMPIKGPDDFTIGKHGLYITRGFRSGVLLPQVAVECGWDALTFLEQVCRKAGLPQDSWKSADSSLYAFEGFVFGESED